MILHQCGPTMEFRQDAVVNDVNDVNDSMHDESYSGDADDERSIQYNHNRTHHKLRQHKGHAPAIRPKLFVRAVSAFDEGEEPEEEVSGPAHVHAPTPKSIPRRTFSNSRRHPHHHHSNKHNSNTKSSNNRRPKRSSSHDGTTRRKTHRPKLSPNNSQTRWANPSTEKNPPRRSRSFDNALKDSDKMADSIFGPPQRRLSNASSQQASNGPSSGPASRGVTRKVSLDDVLNCGSNTGEDIFGPEPPERRISNRHLTAAVLKENINGSNHRDAPEERGPIRRQVSLDDVLGTEASAQDIFGPPGRPERRTSSIQIQMLDIQSSPKAQKDTSTTTPKNKKSSSPPVRPKRVESMQDLANVGLPPLKKNSSPRNVASQPPARPERTFSLDSLAPVRNSSNHSHVYCLDRQDVSISTPTRGVIRRFSLDDVLNDGNADAVADIFGPPERTKSIESNRKHSASGNSLGSSGLSSLSSAQEDGSPRRGVIRQVSLDDVLKEDKGSAFEDIFGPPERKCSSESILLQVLADGDGPPRRGARDAPQERKLLRNTSLDDVLSEGGSSNKGDEASIFGPPKRHESDSDFEEVALEDKVVRPSTPQRGIERKVSLDDVMKEGSDHSSRGLNEGSDGLRPPTRRESIVGKKKDPLNLVEGSNHRPYNKQEEDDIFGDKDDGKDDDEYLHKDPKSLVEGSKHTPFVKKEEDSMFGEESSRCSSIGLPRFSAGSLLDDSTGHSTAKGEIDPIPSSSRRESLTSCYTNYSDADSFAISLANTPPGHRAQIQDDDSARDLDDLIWQMSSNGILKSGDTPKSQKQGVETVGPKQAKPTPRSILKASEPPAVLPESRRPRRKLRERPEDYLLNAQEAAKLTRLSGAILDDASISKKADQAPKLSSRVLSPVKKAKPSISITVKSREETNVENKKPACQNP
eukprot:CAMPEP_0168849494 /NCGR_PEP_ID=MMETSP0727-20121128/11395_1 /TAXON_ID=265536 /ORGANISM="Amphiprora sp., Strain CCMP467" /LENGTH=921 /DNA_ID=CAMNT_0008903397 /DNA_START=93 /DNA_END=2858 /DNA_ORIENTATION=+